MNVIFKDLGNIEYKNAWDIQEELYKNAISTKLKNQNGSNHQNIKCHYLLFCEHSHVYTLGVSGLHTNLLISEEFLQKVGAKFYKINRGGDITYHGPGQIVSYPIFDLEAMKLGIKDYIHLLEESVIKTLLEYGITAGRLCGATGVWLDTTKSNARKICAIGVRASRHITMHGLALNINTNLEYFRYINPCGFVDKEVTSLEKELGTRQNIEEVKKTLLDNFKKIFGLELIF